MLTLISRQGEERSLQWLPSAAWTHRGEVGAFLDYPPCVTRQEVDTERDEVTCPRTKSESDAELGIEPTLPVPSVQLSSASHNAF